MEGQDSESKATSSQQKMVDTTITESGSPLKRGRELGEPSPQEVMADMPTNNPSTVTAAAASSDPPLKRSKPGDHVTRPVKTPDIASEAAKAHANSSTAAAVAEDQPLTRPLRHVYRENSSASVASDISSSSAASSSQYSVQDRISSPPPTSYVSEVPPAPPSTPASTASLLTWDVGSATPLPMRASFQNAHLLEEQQLLSDGAVTPAPTRPEATADVAGKPQPSIPLPEDFSDWAVGDRYEMVRILGRGSYGEVAQAIDLQAPRQGDGPEEQPAFCAIKRIQSPFDQEVDAIRLYREMHILRHMRGHSCIIQLLDVVQPPSDDLDDFHDLYLVFEYVDTDLYKLIMSPQYLTTEHIQTFMYQMLAGLKFIHSFSAIHRDLKPANILLNENCSLKICDFGLARIVDPSTMYASQQDPDANQTFKRPTSFGPKPPQNLTRQLTKHVVTRWYRAPELILIQPYTSAVDIWSLGCILAELLSMQEGNVASYQDRKPLFPGGSCYPLSGDLDITKDDKADQLRVIFSVLGTPPPEDAAAVGKANEYIESMGKIKAKSFQEIFPAADPTALDLLRHMLQFNPQRRATAQEALEHAFFRGVRRRELETVAVGPLKGPDFLETNKVDLKTIKRKTYEEVLWHRDQGGKGSAANGGDGEDTKPTATKE